MYNIYEGDFSLKKINIAIDGPAGAGKSTMAKAVAKDLGILYLDTGSMYRTVALKAIRKGIDTKDSNKIAQLVKDIDIEIRYENGHQRIFLDKEDVSDLIRTKDVSIGASNVAVVPEVRISMVEIQRKIAEKNSVVMDGRDIGTYVLPKANLKIYLTASVEERAKRRYDEMKEKGILDGMTLEEIKKDVEYRDYNDTNRDFAPLCRADDAQLVDTTEFNLEESIKIILELVKKCVK